MLTSECSLTSSDSDWRLEFGVICIGVICIDLSKQTKLKDPQQINFIGELSRRSGARMFFIIEKSEETTFNFSQNFVTIIMETQKIVNLLNDIDNENSKFATKKMVYY